MDFNQIIKSCGSSPAKITKSDKDFAKDLDFKEIKFPVRIHKTKKREKKILSAVVFLVIKIRRNAQPMYQKNLVKKSMLIYH